MKWGNSERFLSLRGSFDAYGASDDERARFVVASEAIKILAEDIRNASSSIEIAAPYVSPKTALLLQKPLSEAHSRGIRISCTIAKEPPQETADVLVKAGVAIKVDNAVQTGLAIFDGETLWYGTLPLLAFPKTDDCSIRLKSPEAAHDLQGRCQTKRETGIARKQRRNRGIGDHFEQG